MPNSLRRANARLRSPARSPTPPEIQFARKRAGVTKTEAGALLHTNYRTWHQWEGGERNMHPAFWELFKLKTRDR